MYFAAKGLKENTARILNPEKQCFPEIEWVSLSA
jgi:hypothetical protein